MSDDKYSRKYSPPTFVLYLKIKFGYLISLLPVLTEMQKRIIWVIFVIFLLVLMSVSYFVTLEPCPYTGPQVDDCPNLLKKWIPKWTGETMVTAI